MACKQLDNGNIEWTFGTVAPVVLDITKVSEAIKNRAITHGLMARGTDRAAIPRDKATGASASDAEKAAAVRAWVEHVESGSIEWDMVARATKPDAVLTRERGILARALARAYPEQAAGAETFAASLGLPEIMALEAAEPMLAFVSAIRAEDAATQAPVAGGLLARFTGKA